MARLLYALLWALGTVVGMPPLLFALGVLTPAMFVQARPILWWALGGYCLGTGLYFAMRLLAPKTRAEWDAHDRKRALWRVLREVGGR